MGNKGVWTPEEDEKLLEGHRLYGNRWTEIARMVPGRTDNAAKNRFAALTAKRGTAIPQNQSKSPSHSGVSENVSASQVGDSSSALSERPTSKRSRSDVHWMDRAVKPKVEFDLNSAPVAAVALASQTSSACSEVEQCLEVSFLPDLNSPLPELTLSLAVGAFRDAAADDASAAGGIDELWRKAELRAVTAEVAESEARVKALEAERDAREARVARASERCRQAEVSIQQATSAVHVARHAQYSLRAAEWAAAVGVREGVAAAEEGRRRLNQLLMLAGSESGRGGNETKSITLGGMLMLEGSEAAAGTRDGLLHGKQQQEASCGAEEQGEQGGAEGRGERGAEGGGRLEGRPLDTLHALKALQTTAKDLSAASFAVSDRGVDLGAVEEHVLSINKKWDCVLVEVLTRDHVSSAPPQWHKVEKL
ncbi:unnamed protein product [Closterium sp. NIES-64]|nr:unnamed protein product [Closterium sp. NIES-64]